MSDDLFFGILLTALAYAGLIATVIHARTVIRRLAEDEFEGEIPGYEESSLDE